MDHGRHGWPIRQSWPMPIPSAISRVLQLHAPESRMSWFAAALTFRCQSTDDTAKPVNRAALPERTCTKSTSLRAAFAWLASP